MIHDHSDGPVKPAYLPLGTVTLPPAVCRVLRPLIHLRRVQRTTVGDVEARQPSARHISATAGEREGEDLFFSVSAAQGSPPEHSLRRVGPVPNEWLQLL